MRDRTIALAGIFQATELVRQAANHGTWSGYAASASLGSLMQMEAGSTLDVYGGKDRLRLGVETLLAVLEGDNRHAESLRYVVGLLQIEKKFRRQAAMQEAIGQRLDQLGGEGADLEAHEREDLLAEQLAELYSSTISQLSPRVIVSGKPQYLKNPRTVNWIRTLLFAGLRSATLWHQLGGGRFELMFSRRKLIEETRSFLTG